jgi:F-type H+-transporting ATPase subunit delta
MEALIAKRYVKALLEGESVENMEAMASIFDTLAAEFSNEKFVDFISAPMIEASVKEGILLAAVEKAGSEKINNLIKLLAEKNRLELIPDVAEALSKEMAAVNNAYIGKVLSDSDMDAASVEALSTGLSKKVDANISLEFVKTDFDGIKVEVEDLGIELNFSKERINSALIGHILKAI